MAATTLAPVRVNPVIVHPDERRLKLAGTWGFRLDPDDKGVRERWYTDPGIMSDDVSVPGCWQGQGFGSDAEDMVWDFRMWARTYRATYTGTGWYSNVFRVPDAWSGARLTLNFGGVHPSAEVWLNGERIGENHEPFVPFGFDVTEAIRKGAENAVVVRVHEQDRILGMAYSWQGDWSGLYRDVELLATGASSIEFMAAYPDIDAESVRVRARIGGSAPATGTVLRVAVAEVDGAEPVGMAEAEVGSSVVELDVPVSCPKLWSPNAPSLYRVEAVLADENGTLDAQTERCGFVSLSTSGKEFRINGEPYYMRGTGDFVSCPETGSPDTDRDRWRRKLQTLRDYGYNYVRCQSYVYGPEYYDAADEVGILIQSEMGTLGAWGSNTQDHVYAWPPPTPAFRGALRSQWNNIVARDVNHPSANLYCMSNELGADTHFPRTAWQCYEDTKAVKPTALVIWTDGGNNDDLPQDFVNAEAKADAECEKPLIQHEFRWWSSFPDVASMHKYSGAMRPYAAEIAIKAAARHGVSHALAAGAKNSQHLQLLEAKGKMEMCRRDNPTLAGICHFNAMDANLSPQGVVDEFYELKVADAATWLRTNGDTVIMCSLEFDQRVVELGDTLACELYVSDFSHPPMTGASLSWTLTVGGQTVDSGGVDVDYTPFRTSPLGAIEATVPEALPGGASTLKATLRVKLTDGDRSVENEWDLWVLPKSEPPIAAVYGSPKHTWLTTLPTGLPTVEEGDAPEDAKSVLLTERLDDAVANHVRTGGRAILAASEGLVRPFGAKLGESASHYFFTPPANYPPYEDGHDGTIIADHPMLGDLPHEGYADLQFYRPITGAPPLDLEPLGLNDADPVIRVMHSFSVGRSLGYLVERRLGDGTLVLCALKLDQTHAEGRYLLRSICAYLADANPADAREISGDALAHISEATSLP